MLELLAQYGQLVGLIFFFFFFQAIVVWTLLPSHKQQLECFRNIPLMDEEHE